MAKRCNFIFGFLLFLIYPMCLNAQVQVPNLSFSGKEITGFTVAPIYTSINLNFKVPSKMDVYLQKRSAEVNLSDKSNYTSSEPSFMYSGGVSTSVSSIFVGEKAYRNNIVKAFLKKDYIGAMNSYGDYAKKLDKSIFKDEVELLYALSLYETGNYSEAFKLLEAISVRDSEYAILAQDNLFTFLNDKKRYAEMEEVARGIKSFSPYSLYIWLSFLNSKDRYNDILDTLNHNINIEEQYPEFLSFRLISLYFLKNYSESARYINEGVNLEVYPLVLDSVIMNGKPDKALQLIADMPDSDIKNLLLTKANIARNNYDKAELTLSKISSEKERLSLFFYTLANNFDKVPINFLSKFNFKDKQNNDYVNFYQGLKLLGQKSHMDAINKLSLVTFNKDLLINSYFYQGIAYVYVDIPRAERALLKYIGAGNDKEKISIAKFLLAQLYFMDKKIDDALMLVDDCAADYCRKLKSDIYLLKNDYDKSLEFAGGIADDRARLLRATAYYNKLDYKSALGDLVKIKEHTPDSEYLLMMCLFKNGRIDDGILILEKNKDDIRMYSAGIEQLILVGRSKEALKYIEKMKNLPPAYKLEQAKLLLSFGKVKDAEIIFNELVNGKMFMYESIQGLYNIAVVEKRGKRYMENAITSLNKMKNFENKDLLLSEFANNALEMKEYNLAIQYVNSFLEDYVKSPYLVDVYKVRGKLFRFTGKYENCINDAELAMKLDKEKESDALFLKAECSEPLNTEKALDIYKGMVASNGRFIQPASVKVIELSTSADDVLSASEKIKSISPENYTSGVVKFINMVDNKSYNKYKNEIEGFSKLGQPKVRVTAFNRIGKSFYDNGDYENSAKNYLKGYYLFTNEAYAVNSLQGAKKSYEQRKMSREVALVDKLLAKNDKKKTK